MINKPPTKSQIRADLEKDINQFLDKGKHVTQVPRGVSGRDITQGGLAPERFQFDKSKTDWTYIPEVVETLEKRRLQKQSRPAPKKSSRPTRRLIYDDFGEPLRWVWSDK